jgi:hypothetical protein
MDSCGSGPCGHARRHEARTGLGGIALVAVPSSNNNELTHHARILMLQNVAVVHVWTLGVGEVREFRDNAHGRTRID